MYLASTFKNVMLKNVCIWGWVGELTFSISGAKQCERCILNHWEILEVTVVGLWYVGFDTCLVSG